MCRTVAFSSCVHPKQARENLLLWKFVDTSNTCVDCRLFSGVFLSMSHQLRLCAVNFCRFVPMCNSTTQRDIRDTPGRTRVWRPLGNLVNHINAYFAERNMCPRQLLFPAPWRLGSSFSVFCFCKCRMIRTSVPSLTHWTLFGTDVWSSDILDTHAHTLHVVCSALLLVFFPTRISPLCRVSDDGQMDTPLEAHLDPIWWQLPEGLSGWVGARSLCLRILWSGTRVSLQGPMSPIQPASRLLRREREQLRVIFGFKACSPRLSTRTQGRRLERFAWVTTSPSRSFFHAPVIMAATSRYECSDEALGL